jgi:hypothetical protein
MWKYPLLEITCRCNSTSRCNSTNPWYFKS